MKNFQTFKANNALKFLSTLQQFPGEKTIRLKIEF